ncbi:MAG: glycosyltransferase family 2 protein [Eubacteriales bacterium]|nr:glycosyltransferase family 2 protein [Eubacteriales bacterium]
MKTVSVIIPAYNAGPFIENCINSILSQTYSNFEIIVVNDGSIDNTLNLLEAIQKTDNRLKIFSQENAGVSAARNTGLKNASGEYITFVDADDALLPNAIETMVSVMDDSTDFAVFSHNEVRFTEVPYIETPVRYKAEELNDNFIKFDEVTWWPWGKLYRRSIITENNLQYDTGISFGEDHIFNLLYVKHIKGDVVVSEKIVYNYYYIRGGLCSKYYPNMHSLQKYVYLKIVDFFGDIPRKYEKYYVGSYLKGCIDYYIAWLPLNKAKKAIKECLDIYNDIVDDEILKEYFTPKQFRLLKEESFVAFIADYSLHNFRKTIVRKYGRKGRRLLESIQKNIKGKK